MNQTITCDSEMDAFKALPVPIIVMEPYGNSFAVRFLNQEAKQLLGVNAEPGGEACLAPDVLKAFETSQVDLTGQLNEVYIHKEKRTIESVKCRDDRYIQDRYFDVILNPCVNDKGTVEQIVMMLYEMSANRAIGAYAAAMADQMLEKDKFLYETQRVARNGTWEIDRGTNSFTWSDMLREIYEVDPGFEVNFHSAFSFCKDEKSRKLLRLAINRALHSGQVFDLELPVVTAKGNDAWLRITGKADVVDGICKRLYGVTQDITENRAIREAFYESHQKLNSLIQTVDGIVWEADAATFRFTFISDQVQRILGYTAAEWLADEHFWSEHIYPDDRQQALTYCIAQTKMEQNHTFDYRMVTKDGGIVWIRDLVSVVVQDNGTALVRGIMVDITEEKLLGDLDHLEKRILELNSKVDVEPEELLTEYMLGLEKLFPQMRCSVLGVKGSKLYNWAAPSLPASYVNTFHNFEIGPDVGSCGTSAYLKQKVIVADIQTDRKWKDFKHLLVPYGLRSSWSYPVINGRGEVMAVLGIYQYTVKVPGDMESSVVERTIAMLKMILENRMNTLLIQESNLMITQGQELANFGTWQWEIGDNVVKWSEVLYRIYGVEKSGFKATFEAYLSMLHADDRDRVKGLIQNVLKTREDIIFEERIIRPDGEQRTLKSWGRLVCDDQGNPVKMIGACLDVTRAKLTQTKLREIAWLQSHVVRAPLARLIGLVDLLEYELSLKGLEDQLLSHINDAAHELDAVIKNICDRTIE